MDVPSLLPANVSAEDGIPSDNDNTAAWVDSDDERIVVSLASNPRLRKLRVSESEDLINGKEYTKRLRRQFVRLHPVPEWANPSESRKRNRKIRSTAANSSDGSDANVSGDEVSLESEDLSVQPLARLLQDTAALTQPTFGDSTTRRKLHPEVIDVHRTKDVGTTQKVSSRV